MMTAIFDRIMRWIPYFTEQSVAIRRQTDGTYRAIINVYAIDVTKETFDGITKMRYLVFNNRAYFTKQIGGVVLCQPTKGPAK